MSISMYGYMRKSVVCSCVHIIFCWSKWDKKHLVKPYYDSTLNFSGLSLRKRVETFLKMVHIYEKDTFWKSKYPHFTLSWLLEREKSLGQIDETTGSIQIFRFLLESAIEAGFWIMIISNIFTNQSSRLQCIILLPNLYLLMNTEILLT